MRKIYFLNFSLYKKHKNVSNKNKEVFINKHLRILKNLRFWLNLLFENLRNKIKLNKIKYYIK